MLQSGVAPINSLREVVCGATGEDMQSCSCWESEGSHETKSLKALLDKLVAARMDLESICGTKTSQTHTVVALELVTGLYEILPLAIEDVRNLIRDIDGFGEDPRFLAHPSAGEPSLAALAAQ
jgi:hypothetical protein